MRHLSGLDASYLAAETAEQPMTCSRLALVRGLAGAELDLDTLVDRLAGAARSFPALRQRPVPVPAGIHQPAWVETGPLDLARHVTDATVGGPGSVGALDGWIAGMLAEPLPRDRPLWSAHLVRSLEPGLDAVLVRTHHSLLDGGAFLRVLEALAGRRASPEQEPAASSVNRAAIVRSGLEGRGHLLARLPRLVGRSTAGAVRVARFNRTATCPLPFGFTAVPATPLDGPSTGRLGYGRLSFPLDGLREVAAAADATVTEVLLAIVSGGLRTYLGRLRVVPDSTLLANVPVALDQPGAPARLRGNNTSSMITSLATDLDDPWARLAGIRSVTRQARRQHALLGPDLLRDWRDQQVPALAPVARLARRADPGEAPTARAIANVNVTAQRGPAGPLTFGHHRLETLHLCGPRVAGVGPNVTAVSYDGHLHVAVLVDAAHVPDVRVLVADLDHAHSELLEVARDRATPPAAARPA